MAKATKKAATKAAVKKTTKKAATKAKAPAKAPAKKAAAPKKAAATKSAAPKKAAVKKSAAKKAAAPKKEAVKKAAPVKKAPAPKKVAAKKSVAKKVAAKKSRKGVVIDDDEEDKPIRVDIPCPFSAEELKEWRTLLRQRYAEVSGDIKDLLHDAMDSEDGHTMPTHQADRGSDSDLQDLSLGMLGDEETLLWQIERAIHKIETGSPIAFGLCEYTHKQIPASRLNLLPWTPLSIQGAAYMEDHQYTLHDMIIDE